jgi:hypothetical protein
MNWFSEIPSRSASSIALCRSDAGKRNGKLCGILIHLSWFRWCGRIEKRFKPRAKPGAASSSQNTEFPVPDPDGLFWFLVGGLLCGPIAQVIENHGRVDRLGEDFEVEPITDCIGEKCRGSLVA